MRLLQWAALRRDREQALLTRNILKRIKNMGCLRLNFYSRCMISGIRFLGILNTNNSTKILQILKML
jgi:hypothetical protein